MNLPHTVWEPEINKNDETLAGEELAGLMVTAE